MERILNLARDNRDAKGRPKFDLNFYAVNKKGEYGGVSLWSGNKAGTHPARFAVADASGARLLESAYLLKREKLAG